ncbi:MAG: DUF4258 domain-containing protein [Armatimonadetes bacterium]|nr:DUF4258 domain-containing protein [Armatimonadota bacterium]
MGRLVSAEAIGEAVREGRWSMSYHAHGRAGKRRIGDEELVLALAGGEILEDYPDDPRGASALVLGRIADGRWVHGVCAFDPGGDLVVITTYVPELPKWLDERTRAPRDKEG